MVVSGRRLLNMSKDDQGQIEGSKVRSKSAVTLFKLFFNFGARGPSRYGSTGAIATPRVNHEKSYATRSNSALAVQNRRFILRFSKSHCHWGSPGEIITLQFMFDYLRLLVSDSVYFFQTPVFDLRS